MEVEVEVEVCKMERKGGRRWGVWSMYFVLRLNVELDFFAR